MVSDDYWQAWQLVEEIIGDRPVDLIELEMAGESLQRAVQQVTTAFKRELDRWATY